MDLVHSYQIPDLLYYLDDFITVGPLNRLKCAHNLSTAIAVWGKCVGPLTVLVVLGIEVDSVNQIACLPIEKLSVLKELITLRLT